jgi:hypothetical protein
MLVQVVQHFVLDKQGKQPQCALDLPNLALAVVLEDINHQFLDIEPLAELIQAQQVVAMAAMVVGTITLHQVLAEVLEDMAVQVVLHFNNAVLVQLLEVVEAVVVAVVILDQVLS